jgi:cytochrome P450 / NADPH-cytochrome P450 reductase
MRACIGRAFAWQEALLVCALILQNFDLRLDDPNYEMKMVQTLTIKPKDFYMRASLRTGITATDLQDRLWVSESSKPAEDVVLTNESPTNGCREQGKPIQIIYGSNTGTSQSFSQKLATRLTSSGWSPTVLEMDSAVNKIKKDGPLIAITASYEGQPPDNAASFVAWLESITDKTSFQGVPYAVFGCGHSDWRSTFQRIPTLVDASLTNLGGTRLTERGVSDAARGDMYGEFEEWVDKHLLPSLSEDTPAGASSDYAAPELKLELSEQGRASHLQQSVQWGTVLAASCLTAPGQPEKRHIEIQLPSNTTYSVGDYLAVLPVNPAGEVQRVIKRFRLPWDGIVSISDAGSTSLPVGIPLPLSELLKGYVELSQPATRKVRLPLHHNTSSLTSSGH